jgi:uncharacterized RmlC-like cupin family protein
VTSAGRPDWKHDGVRVIPKGALDCETTQMTAGMDRSVAIDNASTDEPLECVLVRSDNETVVVNLDIDSVADEPETVRWIDPIHR